MNINPRSIHEIIQTVYESLDSSKGTLDSKTAGVERAALDELSTKELTLPSDRMELIALASRLSVLSQKETPEIQDVVHAVRL